VTLDVLDRIAARGGELRVVETRIQYRPPGVLRRDEQAWIARHRREVAEELIRREQLLDLLPGGPALGEAGRAVPAWHCYVAVKRPHEQATRRDGTTYCKTCHPGTIAPARNRR
jgi:hypothetical protein